MSLHGDSMPVLQKTQAFVWMVLLVAFASNFPKFEEDTIKWDAAYINWSCMGVSIGFILVHASSKHELCVIKKCFI